MWKCVCGETETRILWREYAYFIMLGYGRDESAPTPDGMFAPHFVECFVCILLVFATLSQSVSSRREPIYRARVYVFATHSQSVWNAFTECSQRVRYLYVTYSPCKSMVFGVQKPLFYIAKSPFLACKKWVFAKPKLVGGCIVLCFG